AALAGAATGAAAAGAAALGCAGAAAGLGASEIGPAAGAGFSPGATTRRFVSTTTTLLRPCEKLCLTVPASTGRLRCSVGLDPVSDLSPLLFVSVMRISRRPV